MLVVWPWNIKKQGHKLLSRSRAGQVINNSRSEVDIFSPTSRVGWGGGGVGKGGGEGDLKIGNASY